jgi:glycosyltransferase involved in cell wall biosynthesis
MLGAPPEIIEDGIEGNLVNPKDPDALASRLIDLLGNPALATEMGIRGHRKVLTHFDPSVVARRFERLYAEVAHAGAQSA